MSSGYHQQSYGSHGSQGYVYAGPSQSAQPSNTGMQYTRQSTHSWPNCPPGLSPYDIAPRVGGPRYPDSLEGGGPASGPHASRTQMPTSNYTYRGGPDVRQPLAELGVEGPVSRIVYEETMLRDCAPKVRFLQESALQERLFRGSGSRGSSGYGSHSPAQTTMPDTRGPSTGYVYPQSQYRSTGDRHPSR